MPKKHPISYFIFAITERPWEGGGEVSFFKKKVLRQKSFIKSWIFPEISNNVITIHAF